MSRRLIAFTGVGLGLAGVKWYVTGKSNSYTHHLDSKVVIITGGTAGIGKETCRELVRLDADVIITGRDKKKAMKLMDEIQEENMKRNNMSAKVQFIPVDFSDLKEVKRFADDFLSTGAKLHLLVNNAGQSNDKLHRTAQGQEMTMGVNHLAPVYLTHLLMPALAKTPESRVINVSSEAHRNMGAKQFDPPFEDYFFDNVNEKTYKNWDAYANSKLGNIYFTHALDEYIKTRKLDMKTASLHPGVIRTEFFRGFPDWVQTGLKIVYPVVWLLTKSEKEGAQTTLACSLMPFQRLQSGAYYKECEVINPSEAALNKEKNIKAWRLTVDRLKKLTGEKEIFGQ